VNFLLDTHIWLWMHLAPENLTSNVLGVLKDLKHQLWLSPISVWELSLLVEKRYINLVIPALRDAGATDLLEIPIAKIVH